MAAPVSTEHEPIRPDKGVPDSLGTGADLIWMCVAFLRQSGLLVSIDEIGSVFQDFR